MNSIIDQCRPPIVPCGVRRDLALESADRRNKFVSLWAVVKSLRKTHGFRYGDDELEKKELGKGKKENEKRERKKLKKGRRNTDFYYFKYKTHAANTRRLLKNLMLMTTRMKTSFTLSSRWS
jgi:hypothetical protein